VLLAGFNGKGRSSN